MGVRERFTNNGESTLDGAINSSVTSLDVVDGSTFPSGGFRIIIEDEIIYCLTRSAETLTVVRGAENTTAASHADTTVVRHILTAGALDGFRLNMLNDVGMVPLGTSLSTDDDEFDDESFSGSWSVVQGTPNVTITERDHMCNVIIPNGSSGGQHYAFLKAKSPSVNDWVQCGIRITGVGSQFPLPGCIMSNGATFGAGNQATWAWSPHENAFFLRDFTNFQSQNAGSGLGGANHHYMMTALHLRMAWKGSNQYDTWVSINGYDWIPGFTNQSCASVGTVTHMGFVATSWGAGRYSANHFTYCRFSF